MSAEANSDAAKEMLSSIQSHDVKKGQYLLLKGQPCKVTDVQLSKTGKHGHMKAKISAKSLVSGTKYESVKAGHVMQQLIAIEKDEYQLAYIDEDEKETLRFLDDNGNETEFKVLDNVECKALRDAKQEDTEDEKDFQATIIKAPMSQGDENGALIVGHIIVSWKGAKNEN